MSSVYSLREAIDVLHKRENRNCDSRSAALDDGRNNTPVDILAVVTEIAAEHQSTTAISFWLQDGSVRGNDKVVISLYGQYQLHKARQIQVGDMVRFQRVVLARRRQQQPPPEPITLLRLDTHPEPLKEHWDCILRGHMRWNGPSTLDQRSVSEGLQTDPSCILRVLEWWEGRHQGYAPVNRSGTTTVVAAPINDWAMRHIGHAAMHARVLKIEATTAASSTRTKSKQRSNKRRRLPAHGGHIDLPRAYPWTITVQTESGDIAVICVSALVIQQYQPLFQLSVQNHVALTVHNLDAAHMSNAVVPEQTQTMSTRFYSTASTHVTVVAQKNKEDNSLGSLASQSQSPPSRARLERGTLSSSALATTITVRACVDEIHVRDDDANKSYYWTRLTPPLPWQCFVVSDGAGYQGARLRLSINDSVDSDGNGTPTCTVCLGPVMVQAILFAGWDVIDVTVPRATLVREMVAAMLAERVVLTWTLQRLHHPPPTTANADMTHVVVNVVLEKLW